MTDKNQTKLSGLGCIIHGQSFIEPEMQISVRVESPMDNSMDTIEYLFTMENHYGDPAGTTFHAKTVLLCCVDH